MSVPTRSDPSQAVSSTSATMGVTGVTMTIVRVVQTALTTGIQRAIRRGIVGPSGTHGSNWARNAAAVERLAARFAIYRGLDRVEAREVGREVLQAATAKLDKDHTYFDTPTEVPGIIFGIVRRKMAFRKRSETRRHANESEAGRERAMAPPAWANPEGAVMEAEAAAVWRRIMARLSEVQRTTFTLHREDGLSYPEIAVRLGISLKTVESRMCRILAIGREECVRADIQPPPPRRPAKAMASPNRTPAPEVGHDAVG